MIEQENTSPLLQATQAGQGLAFSKYLPLAHAAPTPYRYPGYVEPHDGPYPAAPLALTRQLNGDLVRPWFNDPSRFVWDEAAGFWRCWSITSNNPEARLNGNSTWVEMVSPDLTIFINNRFPFNANGMDFPALWGGCAVVDHHNAAGFGEGAVLYYISKPGAEGEPDSQQCVGLWIAPYLGTAPIFHGDVLKNPGVGDIVHAPGMDFRDPRVDWDDARSRFVMKLTIGRGIVFYSSTDGLNWSYLSLIDLSDWQQIETPDLVPMEGPDGSQKWLLMFSLKQWNGQTASSVGYLIGQWDGAQFKPDFTIPKRLNWGPDYYAQAITQHGGKTYCWGWMGCWWYSSDLPTQGFAGNHSLVTGLSLARDDDGQLGLRIALLDEQPKTYPDQKQEYPNLAMSNGTSWSPAITNPGVSWRWDVTLVRDYPAAWCDAITVDFCAGSQNHARLILNPNAGTAALQRSASGQQPLDSSNTFGLKIWNADSVAPLPARGQYDLSIVFDSCALEILINGEQYLSALIFPPDDAFGMKISASGSGSAYLRSSLLYC